MVGVGAGILSWETGVKAWWTSVENGNICVRTKESVEQHLVRLYQSPPPNTGKNTHQPPED